MFQQTPEGFPTEVIPPGLSHERKVYLAKEIREFCPPEARDLVCPIPEGKTTCAHDYGSCGYHKNINLTNLLYVLGLVINSEEITAPPITKKRRK